jgi:hypothetical protein
VATDTDWAKGEGSLLTGPIEALAMAITGRGPASSLGLSGDL